MSMEYEDESVDLKRDYLYLSEMIFTGYLGNWFMFCEE